ncbi:NACHT domain-containing protein [Streptomyces sp. NPDC091281]|uniref:NACHT domain-containing protein n=1 Tax=Streptomyces sp. NPDC091281 TaxID=3365985 RepID=UPI0037F95E07
MSDFAVEILEADNNRRGDLFGRLIQDVFHTLGYEDCVLNLHKSGRELDVTATHRTEDRLLVAECKAKSEKIGGDELNKFAGAVEVEKRKSPAPISAYFISLSGYKVTALEQEREAQGRMTLLDGQQVVEELIRGRVIVTQSQAALLAGSCADLPADARLSKRSMILAHEIGWIWAMFFSVDGENSHFTLIHADGHRLSLDLVEQVLHSDEAHKGIFQHRKYLHPRGLHRGTEEGHQEARNEYLAYIARECGEITLEGLPADETLGSRRIRLESLYVPTYVERAYVSGGEEAEQEKQVKRIPFAEALSADKHLALLSPPGGGKTTLLKRLAVAYGGFGRRSEVNDALPDESWFPLLLRCRQLGPHVRSPILTSLGSLMNNAERPDLSETFEQLAAQLLKGGEAILLVDGLDEINDPSDRATFAAQLRTFIGTYPQVRVVVTSREAGFRVVSGAMSSVCQLFRISDLSSSGIRKLCSAWHREVVGDSETAGHELAEAVLSNGRVRQLAVNPLLLTTLLLVRRWLGELPSRRSILYGKAIEVLLMTWNTEARAPLDQEEVIPQLAYAAFVMMSNEEQSVSARRLKGILEDARREMPEVLGYARISPGELIERVEDRSSLLVQSGHIAEEGQIRPLFEFKHLTFQEYLAALATVHSYLPQRGEYLSTSEILEPRVADASWQQVVPLAASLSSPREAKALVELLMRKTEELGISERGLYRKADSHPPYDNLLQCLSDEVLIPPVLVREAIDILLRHGNNMANPAVALRKTKFAREIEEIAFNGYIMGNPRERADYSHALAISHIDHHDLHGESLLAAVVSSIGNPDLRTHVVACTTAMHLSFRARRLRALDTGEEIGFAEEIEVEVSGDEVAVSDEDFLNSEMANEWPELRLSDVPSRNRIAAEISPPLMSALLNEEDEERIFPIMWALCWASTFSHFNVDDVCAALMKLIRILLNHPSSEMRRFSAWAIWSLPLLESNEAFVACFDISFNEERDAVFALLEEGVAKPGTGADTLLSDIHRAALVITEYLDGPVAEEERHQALRTIADSYDKSWARDMLERFHGEAESSEP